MDAQLSQLTALGLPIQVTSCLLYPQHKLVSDRGIKYGDRCSPRASSTDPKCAESN